MKRGDLVTIAVQGSFGKPRPALVIQNDLIDETRNVLVCPLTSSEAPVLRLRYSVSPTLENGLRVESRVMLTNIIAVPRDKCGSKIGSLTPGQIAEIDLLLAFVVGLTR